ncbi:MAG: 4Fe-4S binding protein [Dehalococcoidia bacterium]|nr:4Fe-4S binding protein [Dehalococcoidia bacterium]MCA9849225.1 4Fe-4S binding protein [Dehalococcoidia bacterium]MCB9484409.1 4Fe-4S binding protein [Dehalococcoidia bacterium]
MNGIARSMLTTLSTFMRKPVTRDYPVVHKPLPKTDRAFPLLLWDHDVDEPFCTGCHACERACPVECMTVLMKDNPNHKSLGGDSSRRKIIDKFWIDYARCMRCNICVEVCNFEAIAMNNTWTGHETSVYDRRDLVMDLQQLTSQSHAGRINEWVPVVGQANEDPTAAKAE